MLRINSVQVKLIDCGPAIGCRGLFIDISEGQEERTLYDQLQELLTEIVELNCTDHANFNKRLFYDTAIDGSKRTYLVFTGDELPKKSNYKEWTRFSEEISRESVKCQKDYRVNQLSPPFMIYYGKPLFITGSVGDSGFYQHFNCVIGIIKLENNGLEEYNEVSAQEIVNHPFGSLVIKCDRKIPGKWGDIIKPIIEAKYPQGKIYLADGCDSTSLREFCLLSGFRYQDYLDNEWTRRIKGGRN